MLYVYIFVVMKFLINKKIYISLMKISVPFKSYYVIRAYIIHFKTLKGHFSKCIHNGDIKNIIIKGRISVRKFMKGQVKICFCQLKFWCGT